MKHFVKYDPQHRLELYESEYGNTLCLYFPIPAKELYLLGHITDLCHSSFAEDARHYICNLDGGELHDIVELLLNNAVPCCLEIETELSNNITVQIRKIDGEAHMKTHNAEDEYIGIDTIDQCIKANHITALMVRVETIQSWMKIEPFTEFDKAEFKAFLLKQKLGVIQ